ncbi:hypothetical protein BU17DRAFT_60088 [Hysterangium stoloniferum]|nr:hypothetical protein BU17DRAFT_60088 [Hysterangium stoloniferum]
MTKQQDAQEFFAYILKVLRQQVKNTSRSRSLLSSSALRWSKSHGRGYPIPALERCWDRMGKPAVEYSCPWCEAGVPPQTRALYMPRIFCTGGYSPFNAYHGQGGRPFLEESSHPQGSGKQLRHGVHPPINIHTSNLPHILSLTPAAPVRKAPPLPMFNTARSQPFPTGRCQKALFATRNSGAEAVVVVDWTDGGSACVDGPSLQSKVAAASDIGPEPSVE